jgi:hypothetical protein
VDTTDPNREAIERVLASEPWLVGVKPAAEVVPRFAPNLILHAAPPGSWDDLSDLLRGGLVGAALFEQLAATEEEAEAAYGRDHERLVWIRDELAPALDAALEALGGIDARALMTEALRRGDELHNRNAAATSMLAERLAPALDVDATPRRRIFDVLRDNSQFFVGVSLAATGSRSTPGTASRASVVTAVGANGRDCGIKFSGLGDRWFDAPAEVPEGCGDSARRASALSRTRPRRPRGADGNRPAPCRRGRHPARDRHRRGPPRAGPRDDWLRG